MSMDVKLDRIESKIDKQSERINSIDVTLAEQHISLKEHMRRTSLLEEQLKPIQSHVDMTTAILKIIAVLGGITATVAAGLEILRYMGIK